MCEMKAATLRVLYREEVRMKEGMVRQIPPPPQEVEMKQGVTRR